MSYKTNSDGNYSLQGKCPSVKESGKCPVAENGKHDSGNVSAAVITKPTYENDYFTQPTATIGKKINKKRVIILSFIGVLILLISAFLTVLLYNPVLKDSQTGIEIKVNNGAYGLFGKYSVTADISYADANLPKYQFIGSAIDGITVGYRAYDIEFLKGGAGAEPKCGVSASVFVPEELNKESIGVYYIASNGVFEEVDFNLVYGNVTFSVNNCGVYAIAEKMLKVTFESGFGDTAGVQMVKWGESVCEVTEFPARLGYVFDCWYCVDKEYDFSLAVTGDITLTAHWKRDERYNGYTYITTAEELKAVSSNTGGKYLIINDIDMGGETWSVIPSFSGTLNGGCHSVYNFKINSYAEYAGDDVVIGLFGQLSIGAVVENLQIGKEGTQTQITCKPWQKHVFAGAIAGYNSGSIINCRVVGCTISVRASGQDEAYKNTEFASNLGGICGVIRNGSVSGCYVAKCNFQSESWSRYNNISNTARCGGIVGYADNSAVSDCLIENNVITSSSETGDVEYNLIYTNNSGQPYPVAGGVIGHAYAVTATNVVVYNNVITANKKVGTYSNGEGIIYRGCMFGLTSSTKPGNLIGVSTAINCSGSNPSYPNFTKIDENSYELLIQTDPTFINGLWIGDNGKIALVF